MKSRYILFTVLFLVLFVFHAEAQISSIKTVVSLTGSILDDETHKPVSVRFEAYSAEGKRVYRGKSNEAENGYYFITGLKPGEEYTIKFTDMKYLRQEMKVTIPLTDKYEEFSRDFLVIQRSQNIKLPFHVPPFELGKTKLRYGIEEHIQNFTSVVESNPRAEFTIICFPDNNKNPDENQTLTSSRAEALKAFFISKGAQPENIRIQYETQVDPDNPPPTKKRAKGHRYIGTTYLIVRKVN